MSLEPVLIVFFLFCVPVFAVVGGFVTSRLATTFLRYKEKELEYRRWELTTKLEHARLLGTQPWRREGEDARAWRAALAETAALGEIPAG